MPTKLPLIELAAEPAATWRRAAAAAAEALAATAGATAPSPTAATPDATASDLVVVDLAPARAFVPEPLGTPSAAGLK